MDQARLSRSGSWALRGFVTPGSASYVGCKPTWSIKLDLLRLSRSNLCCSQRVCNPRSGVANPLRALNLDLLRLVPRGIGELGGTPGVRGDQETPSQFPNPQFPNPYILCPPNEVGLDPLPHAVDLAHIILVKRTGATAHAVVLENPAPDHDLFGAGHAHQTLYDQGR